MLTLTTLVSYRIRISTERAWVGARYQRSKRAHRRADLSDVVATVMHEMLVSVTLPQLDFP